MSNENKKTAPENAAPDSATDSTVSNEQLETVVGGEKSPARPVRGEQVSLEDSIADLNGDGNVTLHEVVTYNRNQRDK